jgi:hypothetical protein
MEVLEPLLVEIYWPKKGRDTSNQAKKSTIHQSFYPLKGMAATLNYLYPRLHAA